MSALSVGATEGFYSDGDPTPAISRSVWLGRWSGPCTP